LSNLIYGVQARKGFIVLTGEVGTGKTTMLECLRDYLAQQRVEFAFVFNSRITAAEFLEMVAWDFDLSATADRSRDPGALNDLLVGQVEKGIRRYSS
jgi:general secretion pathway protein A